MPSLDNTIAGSEVLLQERLAAAGRETFGIYAGPFLDPHFGFGRGFARYVSCESEPAGRAARRRDVGRSRDDRTNACVAERFAEWAARRSGGPFFAFVHMWDVHFDYVPPEPYAAMFDTGYDGALDGRSIQGEGFPLDAGEDAVRHLVSLYDGELRYTDDTIAAMLDALDRSGALDDTLVVVTSDHGEEFLEHGGKTHRRTVFVESVHVPLVFWARRGLAPGHRVSQPVSLADVAPTIAELVGVALPPQVEGRSLAPALRGEPLQPRPVWSAHFTAAPGGARMVARRTTGRTAMRREPADEWLAFDLERDPAEQRPLALEAGAERDELVAYDARLAALLDERRLEREARRAAGKKRRADLPADVRRRLRSLGYVD